MLPDLSLYAYGADGKLSQVASELWKITDESGEAVTELTDGTLYELRVSVADGGDLRHLKRNRTQRSASALVLGE